MSQNRKDIAELERVSARLSALKRKMEQDHSVRWNSFRTLRSVFSSLGVTDRNGSPLKDFQSRFENTILGYSYNNMINGLNSAIGKVESKKQALSYQNNSLQYQYNQAQRAETRLRNERIAKQKR